VQKPIGRNNGGERRSQVRRRVGPNRCRGGIIAVAVFAVFGGMIGAGFALAAQKDATTPLSAPRQFQATEQDHAQSPATPRANDTQAPPRAASPAGAASPKPRAPAQTQTTQPKPAAPAGTSNSALPRDTEPVFPALPAASRARMRDCGREWQEMKKTGQANELTWRDFATQCLTR
jgi:hypothetical protein